MGRTSRWKWLQEEEDLLINLHEKYPLQIVLKIYNIEAQKLGLPNRNDTGITVKAKRLKLKAQQGSEVFTTAKLAKLLDVRSDSRVKKWLKEGLKTINYCVNGEIKYRFVNRENFKRFAVENPSLMWGIGYKNLNKFLKDSKLTKDILSFTKQPTIGRPMTIVRINADSHEESVFRSAQAAGVAFDVNKTLVLKNLSKESLSLKKYAFVRLDYPVWWVPLKLRSEFNQAAGEVLYHLYQELMLIEGYSKLTVAIIAVRMAVSITLSAFKSRERLKNYYQKLISLEILLEAKQKSILKKLHYYHYIDRIENIRAKISGIVKFKLSNLFTNVYRERASLMLPEFINEFIYYIGQNYFKREALPLYYQPTNKLENADFWSYIQCAAESFVYRSEKKKYPLCYLLALNFIKKNPPLYQFDLEEEFIDVECDVVSSDEPIQVLGKNQDEPVKRVKFIRC